MLHELMNAHLSELRAAERQIAQRMEVEELSRIERLERALTRARGRLANFGLASPAKV